MRELMINKIMDTESIEGQILSLYNDGEWEKIISLGNCNYKLTNCRICWILPTREELQWISSIVKKHNLSGIISVGSGCGLLEWLLEKYSGLNVMGIELDGSWWLSKYAPPTFLENTIYINPNNMTELDLSEEFALLFCYFNNGPAFCDYVKNYRGKLIIVIGPDEGQNRSTDPLPFDKKFTQLNWKLIDKKPIIRSQDYMTTYIRKNTSVFMDN